MDNVQEKAKRVVWFNESRSLVTVQRRFRLEYGRKPTSNNSINRMFLNKVKTPKILEKSASGY